MEIYQASILHAQGVKSEINVKDSFPWFTFNSEDPGLLELKSEESVGDQTFLKLEVKTLIK